MIEINSQSRTIHWRGVLAELAWQITPPLAYFALMLRFFPHWNMFWIYSDEGYNVMKAMLVARGFSLYSQIWSDQPPLFTQLLAILYRLNGPSVYASRLVVLLFSCLLVWAVVQYLRLAWGNAAVLAGALMVILLPYFPSLSASALVGQPALALAMVSLLALGAWHRWRHGVLLVLSALALGASLLTKLYTAFLIPIFFSGLVLAELYAANKEMNWSKILRPALVWSLTLVIFALMAGLILTGPSNVWQLVQPHWAAAQADLSSGTQNYPITFYLRESWAILILAAVGAAYALKQRRWLMLYPLAWMTLALLILMNLEPVWFHHQMLVTIPAAMLAGGAVVETLRLVLKAVRTPTSMGRSWVWLAAGLVAITLVLATRPAQAIAQFQVQGAALGERRAPFEDKVMRKINQYAAQTNWMVTDLPMFAFRAGIPVPPNLAVVSGKRFAAGEISEQEIIEAVDEFQPEQVLIGRFELPLLEGYLSENYHSILEREDELKLYVRMDLLR